MKKVLFTLMLLAGAMTSNGKAVAADTRIAWFYQGGYLVQDMRTKAWSETINAVETFYFKEVTRNNTYVEIFDPSRNMSVRLYTDAMLLKAANESQYHKQVSGHFDDRRMFYFNNPGGKKGYFLLIGGGMYRLVDQTGANPTSTYLRETYRMADSVRLVDPRTNVSYGLFATELYQGAAGGGALYFEMKGQWI